MGARTRGGLLDGLMTNAVDNLVEYCSREDTRRRLEAGVVDPAARYVAHRFAWGVRLFQAVALLVLLQTLILLWLLLREVRRAAPAAVAA